MVILFIAEDISFADKLSISGEILLILLFKLTNPGIKIRAPLPQINPNPAITNMKLLGIGGYGYTINTPNEATTNPIKLE